MIDDGIREFEQGMPEVDSAFAYLYPTFVDPFPKGRPLAYKPKELADKFAEYIEWAKKHPIETKEKEKGTKTGKSLDCTKTKKTPRLISIDGFLVYIGKSKRWWEEIENSKAHGEAFSYLKQLIREYCESYQKEMASAGIFNANIISRLLGLTDKQEIDAKVQGVTINVTSPQTADVLQEIIDKDK